MADASEIAARLGEVRERVALAARRSLRAPDSVRLVLASKTQPPEAIRASYDAGAREFGENYVQEALGKRVPLTDLASIRWHLIGHLQTNKARAAVENFDLIHSLDSQRLAAALAHARRTPPVAVLIEVNLAAEETKSGVGPDEVEQLVETARGKLDVRGLMVIPPPGDSRRYFVRLRELRDRLAASTGLGLSELSMGMTDDFEVAIEEGATIVRVGRAIFGERGK